MRGIPALTASLACLGAGCDFTPPGVAADAPADPDAPDAPGDAAPDGPYVPACVTDPTYTAGPTLAHSYKVYPDRVSYDAAIDRCTADGAHLAVIEDAAENQHLAGRLTPSNHAWIGFDDLTEEGADNFRWITNAPVTFRGFMGNEPNNAGGEDCTYLRSDRSWNDTGCEDGQRPLCECDPTYTPRPTPACRMATTGFIEPSGRRVFPGPAATWAQAQAACEAMGAHLLVIGDADENGELDGALAGAHWLGYTDAAQEGLFRWVNGATSTFHRWPGGTIPNNDTMDCALLQDGGAWADADCDELHPYACECDPAPP